MAVKKKQAQKKESQKKKDLIKKAPKPEVIKVVKAPDRFAVFNWKMNPGTLDEADNVFFELKEISSKLRRTLPVVCPPVLYLEHLAWSYKGKRILFGVQNAFHEDSGAWTGEVSYTQAGKAGASYAIINHSERKKLGESRDVAKRKMEAAFRNGYTVVLCVGEESRDEQGTHFRHIEEEIGFFLHGLPDEKLKRILLAYEPIWAIGKTAKEAVTPHNLHEMALYMRKILMSRLGQGRAYDMPILYGGSVDASNAESLLDTKEIQGFLIGRASLDPDQFKVILTALEKSYVPVSNS